MTTQTQANNELQKICAAQREEIRQLALALRTLACHASDGRGNLPPMHDADARHIAKMLELVR
jgi:hypothetical protein